MKRPIIFLSKKHRFYGSMLRNKRAVVVLNSYPIFSQNSLAQAVLKLCDWYGSERVKDPVVHVSLVNYGNTKQPTCTASVDVGHRTKEEEEEPTWWHQGTGHWWPGRRRCLSGAAATRRHWSLGTWWAPPPATVRSAAVPCPLQDGQPARQARLHTGTSNRAVTGSCAVQLQR